MIRLAIVDDEVLIREGLSKIIQRESALFQVIGLFADGQEVLDALPELQVDVIITDIRMPLVGGLALIKEIKSNYPHIRTILMSGFVDFNYAQEAIRCSAVDYLLKPINKEQLFELLYRLHQEQQDKHSEQQQHRTRLLSAFLLQSKREEQFTSSFLWMEITLPSPYYVIYKMKSNEASHLQHWAKELQSRQQLQTSELVAHNDHIELDILWHDQPCQVWIAYYTTPPSPSELMTLGDQLLNLAMMDDHVLHIGCSGAYSEITQLQAAYEHACYACELGIYENTLHYFSLAEGVAPVYKGQGSEEFQSHLTNDLQILHMEHIHLWMTQCFQHLKQSRGGLQQIYDVCHRIWGDIDREVSEWHDCFDEEALQDLLHQLGTLFHYNEIVDQVLRTFTSKLEYIRSQRLARNTTATLMIKGWINDHYSEHADLGSLAAMVFLTPTYLSKLFKQETGYTITDYITEVRLHHAKQLLSQHQHLKVQEIGRQVGYADPAYFNKLFKRMVGVTPAEFKKIADSDKQA